MRETDPTLLSTGEGVPCPRNESPGSSIGRYKLLQKIGEGGFGAVWMAEQKEPVKRRVALKIIKLGMDTRQVVTRFEAERQALAMMDHPNIAKVLDAGATDTGRPFFVMELVRGIPITQYCDENHLSTEDRLKLFILVCQAIQHAHQKGIIHRDIKPSNILVTLHDGAPVPKVIDFGIAKATQQGLTDKTLFTQFQQFVGTPVYMSPEQAEMSGLDVDTRADIYSLGVLLYELLTGRTPFDLKELTAAGLDEMRRIIREKEPVRPSTRLSSFVVEELTTTAKRRHTDASALVNELKGDLDWIAMKCLEKDRTRRYETANGLAMDLQRHLNHEPVLARPPSTVYRLQKAMRRNRAAFAAGLAVVLALVAGLGLSVWQAARAVRAEHREKELRQAAELARAGEASERKAAEQARVHEAELRKLAQLQAYAADMKAAQVALQQNNRGQAVGLLTRYIPAEGEEDLRGIEWRYLANHARGDHSRIFQHPGMVEGARFSPDGNVIATGCSDGLIRIWSAAFGELIATIDRRVNDDAFLGTFCFSPDGRTLAAVMADGIMLYDTASWRPLRLLEDSQIVSSGRGKASQPLSFSPDGALIACVAKAELRVWNTTNWTAFTIPGPDAHAVTLSADGSKVYAVSGGQVRFWELATGKLQPLLVKDNPFVSTSVALAQEDTKIAISDWQGAVQWVDSRTGEVIWSFQAHSAPAVSLAVSPDGKWVASAGFDQVIQVIDSATGQVVRTLTGHENEVWTVDFSRDGRWLVSSSKDRTARTWNLQAPTPPKHWTVPQSEWPIGFGADGRSVATYAEARVISFRDSTNNLRSLQPQLATIESILTSADGRRLVAWHNPPEGGKLTILDEKGNELTRMNLHSLQLSYPLVSRDTRWLAVLAWSNDALCTVELFDHSTQQLLQKFELGNFRSLGSAPLAFSNDSRYLALADERFRVRIWDIQKQQFAAELTGHIWHLNSLVFSPDDHLLASSSWDGEVRIWDWRKGQLLLDPLRGHGSGVRAIAFSPDLKTIVSAGDDTTLRFWQVATGREMLVLNHMNTTRFCPLLSPDGETLVARHVPTSETWVERIPPLQEAEKWIRGEGK